VTLAVGMLLVNMSRVLTNTYAYLCHYLNLGLACRQVISMQLHTIYLVDLSMNLLLANCGYIGVHSNAMKVCIKKLRNTQGSQRTTKATTQRIYFCCPLIMQHLWLVWLTNGTYVTMALPAPQKSVSMGLAPLACILQGCYCPRYSARPNSTQRGFME